MEIMEFEGRGVGENGTLGNIKVVEGLAEHFVSGTAAANRCNKAYA